MHGDKSQPERDWVLNGEWGACQIRFHPIVSLKLSTHCGVDFDLREVAFEMLMISFRIPFW